MIFPISPRALKRIASVPLHHKPYCGVHQKIWGEKRTTKKKQNKTQSCCSQKVWLRVILTMTSCSSSWPLLSLPTPCERRDDRCKGSCLIQLQLLIQKIVTVSVNNCWQLNLRQGLVNWVSMWSWYSQNSVLNSNVVTTVIQSNTNTVLPGTKKHPLHLTIQQSRR